MDKGQRNDIHVTQCFGDSKNFYKIEKFESLCFKMCFKNYDIIFTKIHNYSEVSNKGTHSLKCAVCLISKGL